MQQNYGLGLGFRFGLSVDPVLYHLAPQRLSLKTQSKIEFLGSFSGRSGKDAGHVGIGILHMFFFTHSSCHMQPGKVIYIYTKKIEICINC